MRRKSDAADASLFPDEDGPKGKTTFREDPHWYARNLGHMLLGERPDICGGPYPRAEIEEQLRKTLVFWSRFANCDLDDPSENDVREFEGLFRQALLAGVQKPEDPLSPYL
jgi:hypothetical protein